MCVRVLIFFISFNGRTCISFMTRKALITPGKYNSKRGERETEKERERERERERR